jgi:hypothetical protein
MEVSRPPELVVDIPGDYTFTLQGFRINGNLYF